MITGNDWQSSSTTDQAPAAAPQSDAYQSSFGLSAAHDYQSGALPKAPVQADAFIRWLAWVIDLLPAIFLSLFAVIPLIGGLLSALLVTAYLLMRDFKGASPGKLLLGLKVVDRNGGPASQKALLLRNITFALPPTASHHPLPWNHPDGRRLDSGLLR